MRLSSHYPEGTGWRGTFTYNSRHLEDLVFHLWLLLLLPSPLHFPLPTALQEPMSKNCDLKETDSHHLWNQLQILSIASN